MKLRCKSCQQVVKIDPRAASTCPSCGAGLELPVAERAPGPPLPVPEGLPPSGTSKGKMAKRDTGQEALTCGGVMALIYLVIFGIAIAAHGDQATYWVLAIAALIGGIAFAVWVDRRRKRREQ
jgi:hypothetical protein